VNVASKQRHLPVDKSTTHGLCYSMVIVTIKGSESKLGVLHKFLTTIVLFIFGLFFKFFLLFP